MLLYMKMSKRKLKETQGLKRSKRRQAVKSGRNLKSRDMHFLRQEDEKVADPS